MKILIIARDNGSGLTRDAQIFRQALEEAGHSVAVLEFDGRPPSTPVGDVALFLELFDPKWSRVAHRLVLVPNQEWWPEEMNKHLPLFDLVLCKTRHAETIFRGLGCHTEYVGMTSLDRRMSDVPTEEFCLHIAGNSRYKGTQAVLEAWQDHPEWPTLKVLSRAFDFQGEPPVNVEIITERIDDDELRRLQNAAMLHVQPSECEGYGHVIAEALSTGRPVITTSAPPMNELTTAFPVPYAESYRVCMSEGFRTTGELLAPVVADALASLNGARASVGRLSWECADIGFRAQIQHVFNLL